MEYEIVRDEKEKRTYEDLQYGRFFRFVNRTTYADPERGSDTVFIKVKNLGGAMIDQRGFLAFHSGAVQQATSYEREEIIELEQIHPMKFREIGKDGHPLRP